MTTANGQLGQRSKAASETGQLAEWNWKQQQASQEVQAHQRAWENWGPQRAGEATQARQRVITEAQLQAQQLAQQRASIQAQQLAHQQAIEQAQQFAKQQAFDRAQWQAFERRRVAEEAQQLAFERAQWQAYEEAQRQAFELDQQRTAYQRHLDLSRAWSFEEEARQHREKWDYTDFDDRSVFVRN